MIEAHCIEDKRNGLADALSRFDEERLIVCALIGRTPLIRRPASVLFILDSRVSHRQMLSVVWACPRLQDPRSPNAPLFRLQFSVFPRQAVVNILKQHIAAAGLSEADYSGHSFRKAAQHIAEHGMLDESIQKLGCWTSNAFKLYFTTTPETLFDLNLSFQKGILLAVF